MPIRLFLQNFALCVICLVIPWWPNSTESARAANWPSTDAGSQEKWFLRGTTLQNISMFAAAALWTEKISPSSPASGPSPLQVSWKLKALMSLRSRRVKPPLLCPQVDRSNDVNILSIPVPIRRGGSDSNLDVVDSIGHNGVGLDFTKGALGINSLQQKILKVRRDAHTNLSVFLHKALGFFKRIIYIFQTAADSAKICTF